MSAATQNPAAPHTLPWFITAPGDTDTLYVITVIVTLACVVLLGVFFFWLHSLPERIGHKKIQFELVAVLGLISLFTHQHIFWVIGLLLALIDLPDLVAPLRSIAESAEKMAGVGTKSISGVPKALPDNAPPGPDESNHMSSAQVKGQIGNGTRRRRKLIVFGLVVVAIGAAVGMTFHRRSQSPPDQFSPVPPIATEQHAAQTAPRESPAIVTPAPGLAKRHGAALELNLDGRPLPTKAGSSPEKIATTKLRETQSTVPRREMTTAPITTEIPAAKEGPGLAEAIEHPVRVLEAGREPPSIDITRFAPSGNAIIAGRAGAGSEVTVKLNGVPIGKVTANSDGRFLLVTKVPLPPGRGELMLESHEADQSTTLTSDKTVTLFVPLGNMPQSTLGASSSGSVTGIPQQRDHPTEEPAESSGPSGAGNAEIPVAQDGTAATAEVRTKVARDHVGSRTRLSTPIKSRSKVRPKPGHDRVTTPKAGSFHRGRGARPYPGYEYGYVYPCCERWGRYGYLFGWGHNKHHHYVGHHAGRARGRYLYSHHRRHY